MKTFKPIFATAFLVASLGAMADTLEIPLGQQGQQAIDKPVRGANKAQVEAVHGSPVNKSGPTGNPPIYAWEYPEYTVYFEGDFVLHSVAKPEDPGQ